jgi:uncharacterized coiled-coil protein SlyX
MTLWGPIGGLVLVVVMTSWAGNGFGAESREKVTADDVAKEAKETLQVTKEYTTQQKEAFYRKMDEELKETQAQIEKLKAKSGEMSAEARDNLNKRIAELERQKAEAAKKLDEMKAATAEAWTDMKTRLNATMKDMKKSYKRALSRLDQ